ncbi:zinc-ribbon domain-containing protein [Nocardioides pyridinolyticus]
MNKATPVQKLLLAVGVVVMLGGIVCLVMGFADFADFTEDEVQQGNGSLALFAAGGFAMVVGFGIVAFTRAAILTRNGAYARVTIEQGTAPQQAPSGRSCSSCGRPVAATARFCEACGHAVG